MTVLQEMLTLGERPDVNCFNMVIKICGDVGKVDFAFQILDYMMNLQLPPNSYTFAELIDACVRSGGLRRALQVLYEMKSAGWTPTVATYSSMLLACARSSEPLSTLMGLLDQQQYEGRQVPPASALALVEALAMNGRHADAVQLFMALKVEFLNPGDAKVSELLKNLMAGQRDGAETNEALRRLIQLLKKMLGQASNPISHHWPTAQPTAAAPAPPAQEVAPQAAAPIRPPSVELRPPAAPPPSSQPPSMPPSLPSPALSHQSSLNSSFNAGVVAAAPIEPPVAPCASSDSADGERVGAEGSAVQAAIASNPVSASPPPGLGFGGLGFVNMGASSVASATITGSGAFEDEVSSVGADAAASVLNLSPDLA